MTASVTGGVCRFIVGLSLLGASCKAPSSESEYPCLEYDCPPPSAKTPPFDDLVCGGDCIDTVVSKLVVPSFLDSITIAYDLDGDGEPDNALGWYLQFVLDYGCGHENNAVSRGSALNLIRFKVPDRSQAGKAKVQLWIGKSQPCDQGCFDGSHVFSPDPDAVNGPPLDATFDNGQFRVSYGQAVIRFPDPCSSEGHYDLSLNAIRAGGELQGGTVASGRIGGVVSKQEAVCRILPLVAKGLTSAIQSSSVYADNVRRNFDADKDDVVELQELTCSYMASTFLEGDVDVDGDGVKEVSLAVEFETEGAVISVPP